MPGVMGDEAGTAASADRELMTEFARVFSTEGAPRTAFARFVDGDLAVVHVKASRPGRRTRP